MRKTNFLVLILTVLFSLSELHAACPLSGCPPSNCPPSGCPPVGGGRKTIKKDNKNSLRHQISGRLRRLEEDASDLDRKLRRAKPDNSKRYINMTFERYKLSLEMIHECHRYIEAYGDKKQDSRLQAVRDLLKAESTLLTNGLKEHKTFPYPESLADWQSFVGLLRTGKISAEGKKKLPSGDTKLRTEVHSMQKRALDEIHKAVLKQRKD